MKTVIKMFAPVTKKECSEFGLVTILVAAGIGFYMKQYNYFVIVFMLSLVTLIIPIVFFPVAFFWFGLSKVLNAISSRVLLTVIFLLVVTPVGIIRRMAGVDGLKLKQFKKSSKSAMVPRDHVYLPEDLKHTF